MYYILSPVSQVFTVLLPRNSIVGHLLHSFMCVHTEACLLWTFAYTFAAL